MTLLVLTEFQIFVCRGFLSSTTLINVSLNRAFDVLLGVTHHQRNATATAPSQGN